MILMNMIRVWDFYDSVGWTGPDGEGTPTLLLMNWVDEKGEPVENACYEGKEKGFQIFCFNRAQQDGECLDTIGHEFTHCVSNCLAADLPYINDTGAINEALSDTMGNLIETYITGQEDPEWLIGEGARDPETHPELYDADGSMKLPEEDVITFELDTKDMLSQVRTFRPEQEADLSGFTAKVGEAVFTPFLTFITVDMAVKPGVLEAFIAEKGEGEYDADGELMFRYGPMDLMTPWLESLQLADGNGTVLFPEQGGLQEHDEHRAEFFFSYIETLPESLFLAPVDVDTGKADMDRAIPVI